MEPTVRQMRIPTAYGTPSRTLAWPDVRARLVEAQHYWLATTRATGRPHVVPLDGLWLDDTWYFGGSPETLHQRLLTANPEVVLHLPDPQRAVIVEGAVAWRTPSVADADRLRAASTEKYGYAPPPAAYTSGVWALAPRYVLAWDSLPVDPTRFDF